MSTRASSINPSVLRNAYLQSRHSALLVNYRKRRWGRAAEFNRWLAQEELPSLSMERVLTLYRSAGGNRSGDFRCNSIEDIRDSLDFLLYDTIKLESRFDECVAEQGAYKLTGAGKEFMSYLLCLVNPSLFGVWSNHVERALLRLGQYPPALKQGHLGLRYLDLLEALQKAQRQFGLADYQAVDEFAYLITRRRDVTDPGRQI